MKETQSEMKEWCNKRTRLRKFCEGDKVLVLFPVQGYPSKAKYDGPWEIKKKISDLNCFGKTPGREKKTIMYHRAMCK